MTRYIKTQLNISDQQKARLKKSLQSGADFITLKLGYDDYNGSDVFALTKSQINKIAKAQQNGKGTTIKISKAQLKHNMKIEGGFLSMLAGLAAKALPVLAKTVLPALGIGALSGLASTGVQKAMGNGLYLKKGGCVGKIETDGKGLYLSPMSQHGLKSIGDGLYLKDGPSIYDGAGLLLGPNSPLKKIPLLGMLL